jgi:hypothetical protein
MKLINHENVELSLPEINIDVPLHKKLDKIPLLKHMNRFFSCAVIGRAGSGKTSLVTGLLKTPKLMNKIFDRIYVFMPANSRASMKNSIFDQLPDEQLFADLDDQSLSECFTSVEQNARDGKTSLIIFDDVQQFFKGTCEHLLLHMVNNRRHNKLCLMFIAQSYKKIPKMIRSACTDFFIFHVSKEDLISLHRELIDCSDSYWDFVRTSFIKRSKEQRFVFLYINIPNQAFFLNWDEFNDDQDSSNPKSNAIEASK